MLKPFSLFLALFALSFSANAQQDTTTFVADITAGGTVGIKIIQTDSVSKNILLADSCMKMNNTLQALRLYEQAYAADTTPTVLKKLIECHYKRGSYQKCIDLYDRICKDSINVLDLRLKYYCYSTLNQHDSALVYGKMVRRINPYDYNVVAKTASYYNEHELPGSALEVANQYYRLDSTNIFVNRQKAYALYSLGDYALALKEYKKLMELGDSGDMLLYHTALCYENLDSLYQSHEYITKAAEENGYKNPYIVAKLGLITMDIGRPAEAVEIINKAFKLLYPSDQMLFTLTDALSECYKREQDYKQAIKYMKECLQYSKSPFIYYKLAQLYNYEKDLKSEKLYYQKFLDRIKDVPNLTDQMLQLKEYAQETIKSIDEELFFLEGAEGGPK